ncbi:MULTISPECIES: mercuric transporter MerT family protein [Leisingera]|jgi:mercuric ion transport protein|uniref:mercuric transporter MerT family protein n=1 Tax=Leisingera TaxID=191028 RepID=UPI000AA97EED|nr:MULTISPECIES: mercuric transporter MerT family protein [Leisingera]QDI74389.1 mercury transporter [Leisingera aquaemixtae]
MTETTSAGRSTALDDQPDADRKAWATTGLGVLGALAMTSCCILPLVLVSFGVTGVFIAQLGALYQYKWITFALSAAFIGYGFYKAYRPIPAGACADGTCARPMNRKLMRFILWIATVIVAVAMIFPYLTPYLLSY